MALYERDTGRRRVIERGDADGLEMIVANVFMAKKRKWNTGLRNYVRWAWMQVARMIL